MKNLLSMTVILSMLFMTACSPSMKITGSWMNKDMMGKGNYKKVFLFVIASDKGAQQTVENAQAKAAAAEGVTTVKSYEFFGPNFIAQKPSVEQIMAKIRESGCDAVFTSALVDVKSQTRYVPGTTSYSYGYGGGYGYGGYGYGSFGGYYGSAAYIYEPGYYTEDQTYFIESNLYDVKTEEIVWSVQSEAYNPTNVETVARTYSALLFEKLKSEGITAPKK
ncbi:MAG: hypothetical protein IPL92_14060 [Saprospiraceae bacterium]|nr:hypothetical protein [Candidatus Opimibacter iunctus]